MFTHLATQVHSDEEARHTASLDAEARAVTYTFLTSLRAANETHWNQRNYCQTRYPGSDHTVHLMASFYDPRKADSTLDHRRRSIQCLLRKMIPLRSRINHRMPQDCLCKIDPPPSESGRNQILVQK